MGKTTEGGVKTVCEHGKTTPCTLCRDKNRMRLIIADAARYRWVRGHVCRTGELVCIDMDITLPLQTVQDFDDAIDMEIAADT